jgi:hypothetical protein
MSFNSLQSGNLIGEPRSTNDRQLAKAPSPQRDFPGRLETNDLPSSDKKVAVVTGALGPHEIYVPYERWDCPAVPEYPVFSVTGRDVIGC